MDLPDEAYLAGDGRRSPASGPATAARRARRRGSPAGGLGPARGTQPGAPARPRARLWARHRGGGQSPVLRPAAPRLPGRCCGTTRSRRRSCSAGATSPPSTVGGSRVVGTRNASRYGLDVADRSAPGSGRPGSRWSPGLALGVDGAVHRGLLGAGGAPPVGVVACGLDVVYPGAAPGPLAAGGGGGAAAVSEMPLGHAADPLELPGPQPDHRRPERGGGRGRVRGRRAARSTPPTRPWPATSRCWPCPVRSPARRPTGTNRLIADGAMPAVLGRRRLRRPRPDLTHGRGRRRSPSPVAPRVGSSTPAPTRRSRCRPWSTAAASPCRRSAAAIDELCRTGWLAESAGRYERTTPAARTGA